MTDDYGWLNEQVQAEIRAHEFAQQQHVETFAKLTAAEDLLIQCDSVLSLILYRERYGDLSDQTVRDIESLLGPLRRQTDQIIEQRREAARD